MNQEHLLNVILGPHTSEKAMMLGESNNQITFKVLNTATKREIKAAVEKLFNVKVDNVTTVNVNGKQKRFGQTMGRRSNWKKAYVKLAEGHDINFAGAE